ncbi:MAG: hypothetical protein ROO76_11155 [Terriglobia bacterium]|jgi:hypothetical protein|nr:hypothetical protein [Terriglobia bacterium]
MSFKAVSWTVISALGLALILLFNYWASYQPLSTLAYAGIAVALCGLANLALPFRFLGIRKRYAGALIFAGGVALAFVALLWPAPTIRVAQHNKLLDDVMPEYQFYERHSLRIHAKPEQVMQAVRESRFRDMKSVATLMKIRAAALRIHSTADSLQDRQILEAFSASGYALGGNGHEIVMCGGVNVPAKRPLQPRTLQECADYRESGALKVAFDFRAEDAGGGWSTVSTETRVVALDDSTRRGMGRYWRLIVPGSGLLRRQWLDSIKQRTESTQS